MAYSVWFPKQNRAGGEWNSPNVTVPTGIDEIRVHLLVTNSQFAVATRSITATVQVSHDGAQTWENVMSAGWVGCSPPPSAPGKTPGWFAAFDGCADYIGLLVRVHVSQSGTFSWGVEGEIR
jgi:hypothetical protein